MRYSEMNDKEKAAADKRRFTWTDKDIDFIKTKPAKSKKKKRSAK